MRHKVDGRKFDMPTAQRMAMMRNLTTDVLRYGSVQTTEARAKEARRFVDRMVTLGKRGTLHARRKALAFIYDPKVVQTTEARAKEARRFVDRMVTLGKRGTLHARRKALAFIYDPEVVQRLFDELAPQYANRPGGYTRVQKLGQRKGDGSRMAKLELV